MKGLNKWYDALPEPSRFLWTLLLVFIPLVYLASINTNLFVLFILFLLIVRLFR